MHPETVVITGSSGFIGYELCERLAASYNVVALDRPGIPHPPPDADRIDVDITSDESVAEAFRTIRHHWGNKIASVIHLAAYYDFSGEPSSKYDEITVHGTARLVRFLRPFQVEQFVFSSTMLVHAPCQPGQRINEESVLDPKWDYPKSKVKTENVVRHEGGKIPVVFARVAGVYDNVCHSIPLAHQIQRIYERNFTSRVFPGDISHGQSFVHVDDVVDFFEALISKRKGLPHELTLLVGEPETLSYDALQRAFAKYIHGELWETKRIPKWLAKAGAWLQGHVPFIGDPFIKPWMIDLADDHYELDISRARKLLGWQPRRSLEQTLPLMVAALKKNPPGWYKEHELEYPRKFKKPEPPIAPPPQVPQEEKSPGLQNRIQELVGTVAGSE